MVGRHVLGGIGPLGVAGRSEGSDGKSKDPGALRKGFHGRKLSPLHCRRGGAGIVSPLLAHLAHKKRRHERFAVRAGRPVTQTTSGAEAVSPLSSPEYIHDTIDAEKCKYKNRNRLWKSFFWNYQTASASIKGESVALSHYMTQNMANDKPDLKSKSYEENGHAPRTLAVGSGLQPLPPPLPWLAV